MSINMHSLREGLQAHTLPGKGRARMALHGALATIKMLARASADAWAFAHRTKRAMGFSDEGGASRDALGKTLTDDLASMRRTDQRM